MKPKLVSIFSVLALIFACAAPANAVTKDPGAITVDVLIGRPACLVATVVGSAIFVVALPVAATSHSINSAADSLIVKPARATFVRPLGDFGYSDEYASKPVKSKRLARSTKVIPSPAQKPANPAR